MKKLTQEERSMVQTQTQDALNYLRRAHNEVWTGEGAEIRFLHNLYQARTCLLICEIILEVK